MSAMQLEGDLRRPRSRFSGANEPGAEQRENQENNLGGAGADWDERSSPRTGTWRSARIDFWLWGLRRSDPTERQLHIITRLDQAQADVWGGWADAEIGHLQ